MPSGEKAGYRSAAPLVRVTLNTGPFSAGTEKTSPRASIAARLPLGEIEPFWTYFAADSARGRSVASSVATFTGTSRTFSSARPSSSSLPPCSKTMSCGPIAGKWMS